MSNIEWIRTKDKLPPLNEELLVQLEDERIDIGYRTDCFNFSVSGEGFKYTLYEVYAWCYLPESCDVEEDNYINYVSARQFLGCICDVLLELDKDNFLETSIRGFYANPIEEVFAKLFPLDIVLDFELREIFVIIKDCSNGISSCFSVSKDGKITINRKNYNDLYRNFFNKDLDVKIKEKIEKYLKEFFLDRKENV